jgi:hypothetical protein
MLDHLLSQYSRKILIFYAYYRLIIDIIGHLKSVSRPETSRGLPGELHFLNAQQSAVFIQRVVNVWQVQQSRTLTHSTVLVVDRSVTDAHPTVVCSQVRDRDATQMSAHSRAHQHLSISCGV